MNLKMLYVLSNNILWIQHSMKQTALTMATFLAVRVAASWAAFKSVLDPYDCVELEKIL